MYDYRPIHIIDLEYSEIWKRNSSTNFHYRILGIIRLDIS